MTKNIKRNILIAPLLTLVLYLAKMEAINFIVAVWAGVWVMVKMWALERPLYGKRNKFVRRSIRFPFSLFADIPIADVDWGIFLRLSVWAGMISVYIVYSALNELFIPAK